MSQQPEQLNVNMVFGEPPVRSPEATLAFQVGEDTPVHTISQACIGSCGLINMVPEWAQNILLEETAGRLDEENLGQALRCPGPRPLEGGHVRCQQPIIAREELHRTAREMAKGWAEPTRPTPDRRQLMLRLSTSLRSLYLLRWRSEGDETTPNMLEDE